MDENQLGLAKNMNVKEKIFSPLIEIPFGDITSVSPRLRRGKETSCSMVSPLIPYQRIPFLRCCVPRRLLRRLETS